MYFFSPDLYIKDTESTITNKLKGLITDLKGFKFVMILILEFEKIESHDETKYSTFYSCAKAETVINESDVDAVFESIYGTIILKIQKSFRKSSGRVVDSVVDDTINISKYNALSGSSYIKFPTELDHPKKV